MPSFRDSGRDAYHHQHVTFKVTLGTLSIPTKEKRERAWELLARERLEYITFVHIQLARI